MISGARLQAENQPGVNDTIIKGKYRITREIARSNDIVFEAMDVALNRRIALKELNIAAGMTGQAKRERIDRFEREARAAGKLSHPNIVTIYDHWEENGRHFIAMEYLDGQTLRDVMQMRGRMPLKEAIDIATQTLAALSDAHHHKVIHRDIKPDNIFILPGGLVKLTDFGIARLSEEPALTSNGQVFGTPSYMSPEQIEGKHIDVRSDLFSLGVLLYEMLAGRKPFTGDSVISITYAIMNAQPSALVGVPQGVEQVINRALQKRPDQRQISADQMRQDLLYAEQTPQVFLSNNNNGYSQTGMNMRQTGMGNAYGGNMTGAGGGYAGQNFPSMPPMNGMSGMGNSAGQQNGYGNAGAMANTGYANTNMANMPGMSQMQAGTNAAMPNPQAGAQPWAWNNAGASLTRSQIKAMRKAAQTAAAQGMNPQQIAAMYGQNGYVQNGQVPQNASNIPGAPPFASPPFPARPREPLIVLSEEARTNWRVFIAAVVLGCSIAFCVATFMKRYETYKGTVSSQQAHSLMEKGSAAYNKQDYANAAQLFEQALVAKPNAADSTYLNQFLGYVYVQLARQAHNRGSITEALNNYNKAIAYAPDYQVAHTELGILKESAQDVPGARAERDAASTSTSTQQPPASLQAPPAAISNDPMPRAGNIDPDHLLKDKAAEARRLLTEGDQLLTNGNLNDALKKWRDARDAAPGLTEGSEAIQRIQKYEPQ